MMSKAASSCMVPFFHSGGGPVCLFRFQVTEFVAGAGINAAAESIPMKNMLRKGAEGKRGIPE